MSKLIKLDTILLRKIRACIKGDIHSISETGTGNFHVIVTRKVPKVFYRYTVDVKPDTNADKTQKTNLSKGDLRWQKT